MRFTSKRRILNVIAVVFAFVMLVFYDFFMKTAIGIAALALFLLAYFVLTLIWWRCPHCNSYLWKLAPFSTHCPHRGNELK